MNEPIVTLQNVTKRIGGKTIIDKLSFQVPQGEVFGFLGPNGAGKTTTIRMMVGLMSLSEGDILIGGHSIHTDFEKAIKQVGAIVENPEMYKFLSGWNNLVHYARMVPGITHHRIAEVVKLMGLENRIHDKVKTYSLGMRQRLGVAQAVLHKPRLLILDEPTNGLDPAGIRELRDYLRQLSRDEGVSVIVSSHLLSEMELMCDRVAIIQNGRLVDVRTTKELVQEGGRGTVVFEVSDTKLAHQVLAQKDGAYPAELQQEGIVLQLDREEIADVTALLVHAGVKIFGIHPVTTSLEDKFLEMTGSDQIA
ncbi:ABC transporter ATP-binding protein [Paenibacillus mesotrionivorans]|jgi:ABC-2 type transport system ATP-binding protein|uniref:ABC transporter ATP-binding protein n=1 Tax=Paenibacillus mesotrionivorans TaxID=3160968 RepID=A0ACC7P0D7_9BACL